MMRLLHVVAACGLLGLAGVGQADEIGLTLGGDQFLAGQHSAVATAVSHDAFAAGADVALSADVAGDAHLAGFHVDVDAGVLGDLYALGFTLDIAAPVGGDATAAGNGIVLGAPVAGNVRLAGANVTLNAPVGGSALVAAQTMTLGTTVGGDLSFYGETLTFGPEARVDGVLTIRAPQAVTVPASVAPTERVRFEAMTAPDYVAEAGRTAGTVMERFWPVFWMMVGWWLVLLVIGAGLIAMLPAQVEALRVVSQRRPFRNLGLGILALASVLGLVPVFIISIFGILLVPLVLGVVAIACSLAYLLGAFLIGGRIAEAFTPVDTNLKRLGVLALALIAAALIGSLPVVGWLITLGIVVFGMGSAAVVLMVRWTARDAARLSPSRTKDATA